MENLSAKQRTQKLKNEFFNSHDIIIRNFERNGKNLSLIFIDELAEQDMINENILSPILKTRENEITLPVLQTKIVSLCNSEILEDSLVEQKILRGHSALFIDGEERVLVFNTVSYVGRTVDEPPTSTVLRGPREGFTENVKMNICLIRKRLPDKRLKIEELIVGTRSKTRVELLYFNDLVDKKIVQAIKRKIENKEIDGVLDSFYITKFLEDRPNSIFRQIGSCEKPDIACSKILEGRVLILVDGSPIALSVPFIVFEDFQSSNDYYWGDCHRATILRFIRVFGLFIAILFPGMFIALQLYHYKIVPLKFLTTIIITTQNLPLNPFLEVFFIIILFDVLFEASVRMPRYLGMAISIVGALILGETAVKAGLVSPPSVMIVAISAITVYVIPNQSPQISTLRIVFAIIGGTLGFHGIIIATVFLINYLCNIDCFGTPYLAPYAPYVADDQKDFVTKDILPTQNQRPMSFSRNFGNNKRMKFKTDHSKKEIKK